LSDNGSGGACGRSRPAALLILCLLSLPAVGGGDGPEAAAAKIRFETCRSSTIPACTGPLTAWRALDYEFCIPDRPDAVARVRSIDGSVRMHRARGRIGCVESELLCIGNTHQPGFREVLAALSRLPYLARIDQAFFE